MSVSYTCPTCKAKLKSPKALAPGKEITCPSCGEKFKPEGEAAPGAEKGTFAFADDAKKPAAPAKPGAKPAKPEDPKKTDPAAAPAAAKKAFADDDEESAESIKKGYGVVQETEEEKKEAEKNKPKFNEVQEKFKKSARGPAQGLMVMPSNLLIGEGLLTHRRSRPVRRRHVAFGVQRRPTRRRGARRGGHLHAPRRVYVRLGRADLLRGQPDAGTRVVPDRDGRGDHGHRPAPRRHLRDRHAPEPE